MLTSELSYLNGLINDLYDFEEELKRLSLKVYPSPVLKQFITKELIPIVLNIRDIFIKDKAKLDEDPHYNISAKTKAAEIIWSSGYLQHFAWAISESNIKSYPLEIMSFFKDLIHELDTSNFEILAVPSHEINFSFSEVWLPLKDYLEKNIGLKSNNETLLIKLTFPHTHRHNLFLSCIYAHEIGHYFDRRNDFWGDIFTKVIKDRFILKKFKPILRTSSDVDNDAIRIVILQKVLGSWIREAIADCFAVCLLGPAYVYSTMEFNIFSSGRQQFHNNLLMNIYSLTHPPNHLRNNFQVKLLKELGLFQVLNNRLKNEITEYNDQINKSASYYRDSETRLDLDDTLYLVENKEFYDVIEELWKSTLTPIKSRVKSFLKNNVMTPKQVEEALRLAEERIKLAVPPNEYEGKAASVPAILNAGWFARLQYRADMEKVLNNIKGEKADYNFLENLNSLIRYALYASQVHKRWQE